MSKFKIILFLFLVYFKLYCFIQIVNNAGKFSKYTKHGLFGAENFSAILPKFNQTSNTEEKIYNETCEFQINTRYVSLENEAIIFSRFENFFNIIPNCNQTYNATKNVVIAPEKEIVIDGSFRIGKLFKEDTLKLIQNINIGNIKGIDVQSTFLNSRIITPVLLGFHFSKIDIYSGQKILNASQCNIQVYNNLNSFFQHFFVIVFSQVSYPTNELCPLIFLNSVIRQLNFEDITNSFLTKNRLKFIKLSVNTNFDLGTRNLIFINLFLYNENLSADIMNKHLFKRLIELKIFRTITKIETGILREFRFLKNIDFQIDNLRQFFHEGNSWFNDLNHNIYLNLNNSVENIKINIQNIMRIRFQYQRNTTSFDNFYEYPDEDLCLFKEFPHSRSVYAVIEPGKSLACTCTLVWIQFYHDLYQPFIKAIHNTSTVPEIYVLSHVKNTIIYCSIKEKENLRCDFENRFKKCEIKSGSNSKILNFENDIDLLFFVKWMQFILLTILQPFLGFLGLINNILTIICIKNVKKKKAFKDPMYKHILINSYFNSAYCIVMILKLINTCIFHNNSVFCSSIYQTESAQYSKIILIFYFGNVMKMCSNISYISFTFSRFILVSNLKEKRLFKTFNNIRLNVYFFVVFFVSCLVNSFTIFQYTINIPSLVSRMDFPYEKRNEEYCEKEQNKIECDAFNAMKITNKFFNDILNVIIIFSIDLFLLKYFHKHVNKKATQVVNSDPEHYLNIQKSKKNINRMILTTNIIYALAHMPEFVSAILLVSFSKKISKFCQRISCDILNEEAQFFCLISIVCQFYIFITFKKTFKSSLKDLISRFIIIKRQKNNINNSSQVYLIELKNLNALIGDGQID